MNYPNHFSDHALQYKMLRPTYPDALFAYLATLAPTHDFAWDCATGNGQAAQGLVHHFQTVVATDTSQRQIAEASLHAKVGHLVALAERTPLKAASVDPVTVAAALHWLDHERFYSEVWRVLRPEGVLACWAYHLQTVNPEVDAVVGRLYSEILGPYWFPETRHLEDRYRSLPFLFDEVTPPPFRLVKRRNMGRLAAFMGTWSSSLRFRKETGRDALDEVRDELAAA